MKHLHIYSATAIMFALNLSMTQSANAHVIFNEMEAPAKAFHTAQLRVMHGCAGSPTTSVTINIPDGVTRVTPRALTGWNVSINMKKLETPMTLHGFEVTETVGSITWSGGRFEDFAYEQFEMRMMMPDKPGLRLEFPVHQKCETGELHWNQIAKPDADPWSLDEPAPFITLIP